MILIFYKGCVSYKQYKSCDVDVTDNKGLIKVSDTIVKNQNIQFAIDMDQEILFIYLKYCIEKISSIDNYNIKN